jgi:carboxylesterase
MKRGHRRLSFESSGPNEELYVMKRTLRKKLLTVVAAVPLVWLAVDFAASRITRHRWAKWEEGVPREASGIREGCGAFTVGDGPVAMLMVHGFADTPHLFRRMAPVLAERGMTCRALRLPGFAEPMAQYRRTGAQAWQDTLAREVAELQKHHETVWMTGHSMGGALCLLQALDHPESVDGLVLLAPLLEVSRKRSPVLSPRRWFKLGTGLTLFNDLVESYFPIDMRDMEAARQYPRDVFVPVSVYEGLFELLDQVTTKEGPLHVPLFTALSPTDRVVDSPSAEAWFHRTDAPRKLLVMASNSGHVIPWDMDWAEVTREVAAFCLWEEAGASRAADR